jgi:CheY-like chemotaxis protein
VCGSLFWLELPAECELGAATPALRAAQATLPAAPRRVLLVDDIAMNRDVIAAFLRAGGHSVLLASGGAEAVGLAAADRFDVILMDLRMADMDGLEATRRIRLLPAPHGEVTILALTAQPVTGRETELAIAGLDGLLAKPVDYATLMRAVAQVPLLACQHEAPDAASSLPLFDSAVLDQTMAFLSAGEAAVNLALLRERKQELVRLIDAQPQPALLAETAHGLAAAAGMFGFIALSSVCRRFEQAVAANLPDATLLAGLMRTETENALHKLDQVLRAGGIGAT